MMLPLCHKLWNNHFLNFFPKTKEETKQLSIFSGKKRWDIWERSNAECRISAIGGGSYFITQRIWIFGQYSSRLYSIVTAKYMSFLLMIFFAFQLFVGGAAEV